MCEKKWGVQKATRLVSAQPRSAASAHVFLPYPRRCGLHKSLVVHHLLPLLQSAQGRGIRLATERIGPYRIRRCSDADAVVP